jgi:hypothetical protein
VSVTSPVPDESGIIWTAVGQPCFYCHDLLTDPAVHWMGSGGDLYLHPACVSALFIRLARDVHEIECPDYYQRIRAALREYRGG